ncbi:BQ2448_373 [Microbotryum intermedium]|uniref:BQ2448_373 protein n=1 Tax=Microbotryum intermedium TaxID=269621 RepID=A0A238F293_9BASI|nr:BQ2448_373 [Microbotryum intermedium]
MVAPPTWIPPLSSAKPDSTSSSSSSSSPSTSRSSYLSTVPGELAFFRALIYHRPIGPDRHWEMLSVALKFRNYCRSRVSEGFEEYRNAENVEMRDFWDKYDECYDLEQLEKTWENEQYEEDSNSEANSPPVSTRSDAGVPQDTSPRKSSTKPPSAPAWIFRRFPPRPFSLLVSYPPPPPSSSSSSTTTPPVSSASKARGKPKSKDDEPTAEIDPLAPESTFNELLVQRKLRKKGDPASPELGPVREFSLAFPDDSDDDNKESDVASEDEKEEEEEEEEEEAEEDERPKSRKRSKCESTTTATTRTGAGKSTSKTKAHKKAASEDKAVGVGAGADSESDLTDMSDDDDGNDEASEANRDEDGEDEDEEGDEEKTTVASKVSKRSRHTRSSSVATAPEQENVGRRKTQKSLSAKAEPKAKRGAASKVSWHNNC